MKLLYFIIIAIVLIIIVGLICFKLGYVSGKKSLEPTVAQYKKVIEYYNPVAEEIFSIFGKITKIEDRTLSIETTIQDPYKLPKEWEIKIVKVIITDQTENQKK